MHSYLAFDLGAESGRLVRGTLHDGRLRLEEIHRFANKTLEQDGHVCWDTELLFKQMQTGLGKAARAGSPDACLGVDTWGVDYVLLDRDSRPAGPAVTYRDARSAGMLARFLKAMPAEDLYARTGIQFLEINTLFQLYSMAQNADPHLAQARGLLLMADYFHFLLCGAKNMEYTNATTTQMINLKTGTWDADILAAAGIPARLFQAPAAPGTTLGRLSTDLAAQTGLGALPVAAPATHDTASAVVAVPAQGRDWAYISSGTWSLMGIEIPEPITSPAARAANFTNEGGVDGSIRFLKNIMGLWLVQRCRADFAGNPDYTELTRLAQDAPPFAQLVCADDARFLNPQSMTRAIADFCTETGQSAPDTPGAFVRCCLQSLALHYRLVLEELRRVQDQPIARIHIIGGGSRNAVLCQMAADATGLPVLAGPAEATAAGNIVMLARAMGHIGTLAQARRMIADSFETAEYAPGPAGPWDAAYERYLKLREKTHAAKH
jgi:rhamnulokinase